MSLLTTLVAAATFLFTPLAASQQSSPESGQGAGTIGSPRSQTDADNLKFSVRSNLVFLPTRIQSKRGETIYGLKPEDFILEDNGVRQSVHVDEDPESSGLSLVVAVQCSRSASLEFSKLKGLGAMIDAITGEAPHEVAIVSYGEAPYVLGNFSSRPQAVRLALSKFKACGYYGAASIDTVYYAMNMLKRRQNHYRRAILLIGETRDHGSRSTLQEVVAELGITDTMIFSVAFAPAKDEIIEGLRYSNHAPQEPAFPALAPDADAGASEPAPPEPIYTDHAPFHGLFTLPPQIMLLINALRKNSASELASLSGGEYLKFTTQRGFEQDLQQVSNQLHNYYLLSFTPAPGPAWGLHELRVRVASHPDAVVQTRRSYWAGILESFTLEGR